MSGKKKAKQIKNRQGMVMYKMAKKVNAKFLKGFSVRMYNSITSMQKTVGRIIRIIFQENCLLMMKDEVVKSKNDNTEPAIFSIIFSLNNL